MRMEEKEGEASGTSCDTCDTLGDELIVMNIKNIIQGKPLTASLSSLNQSCNFQKKYLDLFLSETKAELNAKRRDYYNRPDVKKRRCEWYRKYFNRPEVKARRKLYNQRPEVRAKMIAYLAKYNKLPRVMAYKKVYNRRPEVMARHNAQQRIRYQRDKLRQNILGQ